MKSILLLLVLISCSKSEIRDNLVHDSKTGLTRTEFRNNLVDSDHRNKEIIKVTDDSFEDIEVLNILDEIDEPQFDSGKLVSISVTEDIPLKDVLIELGRLAEIEMEVDPTISGGIILMVKDRPFIQIIKQISSLANLRYSVNDGILRIENDMPYIVNYSLDFLDSTRTFTSTLSLNTGTSTDAITTGSDRVISSASDSFLWDTVLSNISNIISDSPSSQTTTATATVEDDENTNTAQQAEANSGSSSFVSSNKKAGIITISTSAKKHKFVKEYLDKVKRNVNAQVLIEAKIIEVSLDEQFSTGIDWSVSDLSGIKTSSFVETISSVTPFQFNITRNGNDKAMIQMLEKFGTTRTLSSPRITALNNQQAVLTFTENRIYFEVTFDTDTEVADDANSNNFVSQSIDSEMKTIPIGVILALQPSINLNSNEVLINVRPTISSVSAEIEDPAVQIAKAELSDSLPTDEQGNVELSSKIPQVKMREIDTLVRLKSGSSMVMGGLIEHENENIDVGIPYFSSIPIIGNLFKGTTKKEIIKETVIFIKATILESDYGVSNSDQNFYNNFTNDRNNLGL